MKKFLLLLLLIGRLEPVTADEAISPRAENRFLFVVETSSAMTRFSKATKETVASLIESGVQGQVRPGDTFGLWVFNERLNATFQMQRWSADENKNLAAGVSDFLTKVRLEKKGDLRVVLSPLEPLVTASRALTVILISSGDQPIRGTPFDEEINAIYPLYAREFRNAKTPFVTILVARNGKWAAYSVNSSRGPLQIPNPPLPPVVNVADTKTSAQKTNSPKVATNAVAPKRYAKENIIMTKPVVTKSSVTNATITTNPTAQAAVEKTNEDKIIETTNILSAPAPIRQDAPLITASKTSAPILTQPSLTLSSNPGQFPPETQHVLSVVKNLPRPGYGIPPTSSTNTATLEPTPTEINQTSTAPVAPVVIGSAQLSSPRKFFIAGLGLLLLAGILVFFIVRNSRTKSESSLISRSMNQRGR